MPSGLHARELGTIFYSRVAASGQTDGTVWMMAGDGTNDQQVTDGEWPRLSPDKTPVIFLEGERSPTRGASSRASFQAAWSRRCSPTPTSSSTSTGPRTVRRSSRRHPRSHRAVAVGAQPQRVCQRHDPRGWSRIAGSFPAPRASGRAGPYLAARRARIHLLAMARARTFSQSA